MLDEVRREIEEVHDFIQEWIRGAIDDEATEWAPFAARFADDFTLVGPGGGKANPPDTMQMVRGMHATNADFEIWIDDVALVRVGEDLIVAVYTEWQRHAIHSRRPFNGRWSTVAFDRTEGGLRWAWLHETWMPDEVLDVIERGG